MSKELVTVLPRSITEVTEIDFEGVFNDAITIFAEQAMMSSKKPEDLTISDLKLSAARADNFLNALGGMLEISHKVELLAAEKLKFKRVDELALFNDIFEEFQAYVRNIKTQRNITQKQLNELYSRMEDDEMGPEDIGRLVSLNAFMSTLMENMKLVSDASRKLIEAERKTGGRSYGNEKGGDGTVLAFLEGIGSKLPDGDDSINIPGSASGAAAKPRKLSKDELEKAMNNAQ